MPIKIVKRNGKYRLVERLTGRLDRTKSGRIVDGGGHATYSKALAQLRAIEISKRTKKR